MSPNPEQFPTPEQPNHLPTAGENPNEAGHLQDIPYDTEPIDQHYPHDKDHTVDTGQIEQVLTTPHELPDGRTPARELPTLEKKKGKRNLFIALGLSATSIVVAAGAMVGATGNGFVQNPKDINNAPTPDTTASAPVTPGQIEQGTKPTSSAEIRPGVTKEDLKFYSEDGQTFQTFEDVQKAAEFTVEKFPKQIDTIPAAIERMEDVANYLPSEKTVRASLNKPNEQLTREDFLLVAEEYRVAHDVMFGIKSGDLYDTFKEVCQQAAFNHFLDFANGKATPYAVEFTLHTNKTGLRISDNSGAVEGTTDYLPYIGDYRLMSSSNGRDITQDNGSWKVAGNMELIKQGK